MNTQTKPETLDNEPVVKTFTDADTRLYAVKGVVTRLPPAVHYGLKVENPVPLVDADGSIIGSARVLAELDGTILAEGLFQYGCPERLSIETGIPHFFHPSMNQTFLYVKPEDFQRFGIVTEGSPGSVTKTVPVGTKQVLFVVVAVDKLVLSASPRVDAAIDPVVGTDGESAA